MMVEDALIKNGMHHLRELGGGGGVGFSFSLMISCPLLRTHFSNLVSRRRYIFMQAQVHLSKFIELRKLRSIEYDNQNTRRSFNTKIF